MSRKHLLVDEVTAAYLDSSFDKAHHVLILKVENKHLSVDKPQKSMQGQHFNLVLRRTILFMAFPSLACSTTQSLSDNSEPSVEPMYNVTFVYLHMRFDKLRTVRH